MSQLDTPPAEFLDSPSPDDEVKPTIRDVQRTALADLLELSAECQRTEAELESRHRQTQADAEATLKRSLSDNAHRLAQGTKQTEQQAADAAVKLETEYKTQQIRIKQNHAERQKVALAAYEAGKADIKKKFDHATWLADSVLEAAEVKAKSELRAESERAGEQTDQLGLIEKEAAESVQKYGVRPVPVEEAPPRGEGAPPVDAATYENTRRQVDAYLHAVQSMGVAKLFTGALPIVVLVLATAGAAAAVQSQQANFMEPDWQKLAVFAGGTFVGLIVLGIVVKALVNGKVKNAYAPLRQEIAKARVELVALMKQAASRRDEAVKAATAHRNGDIDAMRQRLAPVQKKAAEVRDAALKSAEAESVKATAELQEKVARRRDELTQRRAAAMADLKGKADGEENRLNSTYSSTTSDVKGKYAERRSDIQRRWREGLSDIQAPMATGSVIAGPLKDWRSYEKQWTPPREFPPTVTFGKLDVNLKQISAGIPRDDNDQLPDHFDVPAMLAYPRQGSLIIETDPEGREDGLRALQSAMTRLLTSLPSGRARFTIIDPVGLGQSFAGFMHLADHDELLVTSRIWTTPEQIDQRLTDLTEHMETVIQKYLRNEYLTIDEYNAQAGELAEPYRILVLADFPSGLEGEAFRRLMSIARSGARCGVYTLILRDVRQGLPPDVMIEDLEAASTVIRRVNGKFVWQDEVFGQFPLQLDPPADEETLTKIVNRVGAAAKLAKHVEVSFDTIAPKLDDYWTQSAAHELAVPVGKMGATRLQYFRCGRGMAQHSLVAGKTGSGKSTLLHAMITNLAMWYSPDEVEFYLIDFKKGVEFKTYADFGLPHARAIAVESDREFGLSVLQRIDAELARRGEIFRKAGTQDLGAYRKVVGGEVMPRVMLIIDEFQEFFTEDDRVAQESQLLMDRLVRQGRAFGCHVFLGSQTIGGSGGLARSTISQMGIRIALQCNETDSQLILGDNNSAARLLSRPGEAIFNDAGGAVENNSPFQVAYLSDEKREGYLANIEAKLKSLGTKRPVMRPLVFEGNSAADFTKNNPLLNAVANGKKPGPVLAWIGDPVAIKDPTGVSFRRQSGANMMIIGQADEQALATLAASVISVATQLPSDKADFVIFDGTPSDSVLFGQMEGALEPLPHTKKFVEYRDADDAINALTDEMNKRREDAGGESPQTFVLINGLQRYRTLRKGEDEGFSFSMSDEPKKASPSKQLVELIKEGPNYGIHILAWIDTLASIERTFERGLLREFDSRILFQMSANDSSNLIDSPAANKLGLFRGLAYSEEQGVMEKFRPYGLADKAWVQEIAAKLK